MTSEDKKTIRQAIKQYLSLAGRLEFRTDSGKINALGIVGCFLIVLILAILNGLSDIILTVASIWNKEINVDNNPYMVLVILLLGTIACSTLLVINSSFFIRRADNDDSRDEN